MVVKRLLKVYGEKGIISFRPFTYKFTVIEWEDKKWTKTKKQC